MLEFENVSKSFWTGSQHKVILDHVSFRVELGNSLGILAPKRAGRTMKRYIFPAESHCAARRIRKAMSSGCRAGGFHRTLLIR